MDKRNLNPLIWFKTSAIAMLLTAAIHVLSFVTAYEPINDQEKELINLSQNYKFDMGAGFYNTYQDHMTAFSVSFTLLHLSSALIILILSKKISDQSAMASLNLILLITHLINFLVTLYFTFLPPIIFTGVITFLLSVSYFLISKKSLKLLCL